MEYSITGKYSTLIFFFIFEEALCTVNWHQKLSRSEHLCALINLERTMLPLEEIIKQITSQLKKEYIFPQKNILTSKN